MYWYQSFTVSCTPTAIGTITQTLSFDTNDADEDPAGRYPGQGLPGGGQNWDWGERQPEPSVVIG